MNPFTRNLFILFAVSVLLFFAGIAGSAIVEYKPYGVPDVRRAEYEEMVAEIKLKNELLTESKNATFPMAEVDQTEFDFGMLDPHTTASHSFRVVNKGKDPLALEVLGTSCKCTTGSLVNGLLRNGESTDVTLTWNTGREAEHYVQTASLKTNDPLNPSIELSVKGTVRAELVVPEKINFAVSDPAHQTRSSFVVYSQLWDSISVSEVTSDLDFFEWTAEPISVDSSEVSGKNAKSAWKVNVFTTSMEYGKYVGVINLAVVPGNGDEPHSRSIVCAGKVRSPIGFYAPEIHSREGLDMGTLSAGKKHVFQVVARVRGDVDREIAVLDIKPEALSASIKPMSQVGSYRLTITVPEDCPMVMFNANHKHGYVQVGDPNDPKFMNWFPIMGAVVKLE